MPFQMITDIEKCTGCGICELAYSLYPEKECNPEERWNRVVQSEDGRILYSVLFICQQRVLAEGKCRP